MIVEGGVALNMVVRVNNRETLAKVIKIFEHGEYYKVKYLFQYISMFGHTYEVVDKMDLFKVNTIHDT